MYILWTYMKVAVTVSCDTLGSRNAMDPDMVNRQSKNVEDTLHSPPNSQHRNEQYSVATTRHNTFFFWKALLFSVVLCTETTEE